jgi:hypothetical protein
MGYIANAANRIKSGENLKEIILDTLNWIDSQADVNNKVLDELLKISAVLHLIELDIGKGKLLPEIQKRELEFWAKSAIQFLDTEKTPVVKKATKLLFVSANPMESIISSLGDQPLIQAAEEFKDMEESIRYHQMIGEMPLESIFEASFTELSEKLNAGGISILHFSNHGDENGIILNKGDGFKEHVGADQLSGLLKITQGQNELNLIFLNSCNSDELAKSIFQDHQNLHIISHNRKVPSDLVREFAAYFYRILAQGIRQDEVQDNYVRAFNLAINKFPSLKGVSQMFQAKNTGI